MHSSVIVRRLTPKCVKQASFDVDDVQSPLDLAQTIIAFMNDHFADDIKVEGSVAIVDGALRIKSPVTTTSVILVAQSDLIQKHINPGTTKILACWQPLVITSDDDIDSIQSGEGLEILHQYVSQKAQKKAKAKAKVKARPAPMVTVEVEEAVQEQPPASPSPRAVPSSPRAVPSSPRAVPSSPRAVPPKKVAPTRKRSVGPRMQPRAASKPATEPIPIHTPHRADPAATRPVQTGPDRAQARTSGGLIALVIILILLVVLIAAAVGGVIYWRRRNRTRTGLEP